ncbi:MAG: Nif3-like dinuclear metal center hexameric protein [Bacteroidetes bacterium]|nr:Nif3-like dinuclear metal center hexameric protein [Bacteroidota bacterium]MBU1677314.1 Nif3-like dinuclear metal center hexameric protein [Bacteroidota bacterium]MBU2506303.1 Nif3-like dinuclear metal center hexameric protein [Bacteroidota bacterium]
MQVESIINFIENWAPPGAAWDKDNVGLQVGSKKSEINNILISLELTEAVLKQAIKKSCNFIFTHHPFLFKPLSRIDTQSDPKGRIIKILLQNDVTVYSAHTNLDFTKNGVSFTLAKQLGLMNIRFLVNQESNQYKLVVFVPEAAAEKVSDAIFSSGGGIIGEYSNCGYRTNGKGSFKGSAESNPKIGEKEKLEYVDEVRLEVLVDCWKLSSVIKNMIVVHPYEEPAFDIYPLKNKNVNYGFGAIGELEQALNQKSFMQSVDKALKAKNLRYSKWKVSSIKRVAVCGGSGMELLNAAINAGADAFVTADIKYHTFEEAEDKILLIDAGHYETEVIVLNQVKKEFEKFIRSKGENIKVYKYSGSTNPVKYF